MRQNLAGTRDDRVLYDRPQFALSRPAAREFGPAERIRALTSAQRNAAIHSDTKSFADRQLRRPANPVVAFCLARRIAPFHLLLLAVASGGFAALFLAGGAASPLLRFWAGIFLLSCVILELAAGELPEGSVVHAPEARVVKCVATAILALAVLAGTTWAGVSVSGSPWIGLLGLAAAGSAAIQVAAFDAARSRYLAAAGARSFERRQTRLELSLQGHAALMRGLRREALIWHYFGRFRRMQESLVPEVCRGSAEFFWQFNRRRIAAWTLLSPRMFFLYLASSAVISAFQPGALPAVLWLIAGAGNVLLFCLLFLGWKTRPVNA